jgi:integrase/recombinase XerD
MIIKFERRTDRPDADSRCQIHLRAYFDGHRLRLSKSKRCTAKEWDADAAKFRKTFAGYQDANDNLTVVQEHEIKIRPTGFSFRKLTGIGRAAP